MKIISLLAATMVSFCAMAADSVYTVPLKDINGKDTSLKSYQGKVLLIVNTASQCGLTPQYKQLESLHQQYKEKGFTVLGFPCNDFGAQEPGSTEEIKEFCQKNYGVSFPMFDKVHVKGPEQHPLYFKLSGPDSPFPGDVKWNFGKFLVGKDGKILKRFEPQTKPDASEVTKAIEEALASK